MNVAHAAIAAAISGALVAGCSSSSHSPSSAPSSATSGQPSSSPSPASAGTPTTAVQAFDDTLANLRNLATAEETYFTDHGTYSTSTAQLRSEGFTHEPGTDAAPVYAGADARFYCLLGAPTAHGPWVIYDNQVRGGFVHKGFTTRQVAASYCTDRKIKHYAPIG